MKPNTIYANSSFQKMQATSPLPIAARLMAELKDEQRWTEQFKSTTDKQWDRLADMVRQEIVRGDTSPLDDAFPVKP